MTLLSQDEARFGLVPTLCATLGLKGCRPRVPTRDGRDLVHLYAAANVVTGRVTARLAASTQWGRRKAHLQGLSRARRLQHLFVRHLQDIARAYPPEACARVEVVIDNAPWHAGAPVRRVLQRHPHLHLFRLPSYSPQLQPIERLWRRVRGAATHNVLFDSVGQLAVALRRCVRHLRAHPDAVLQSLGPAWSMNASGGS